MFTLLKILGGVFGIGAGLTLGSLLGILLLLSPIIMVILLLVVLFKKSKK